MIVQVCIYAHAVCWCCVYIKYLNILLYYVVHYRTIYIYIYATLSISVSLSVATGVVIVLQTVLQELRHLNLSVYKRVLLLFKDTKRTFIFFPNDLTQQTACTRNPTETANDYNDRLIRIATHYMYCAVADEVEVSGETGGRDQEDTSVDSDSSDSEMEVEVDGNTNTNANPLPLSHCNKAVVLLSNDKMQRERCREEYEEVGVLSLTVFISQFIDLYPELSDLHATMPAPSTDAGVGTDTANPNLYESHCDAAALSLGLKGSGSGPGSHRYYKGILQCKRGDDYNDCYVIVHMSNSSSADKNSNKDTTSISIKGYRNVNRAISGDSVAVQLLTDPTPDPNPSHNNTNTAPVTGAAAETAEASTAAIEGLSLSSATSQELHGCVVGILRRSARQYAGSIDNNSTTQSEGELAAGAGSASVLFRPVDKRIPPVRIATRRLADLLGQRLLVNIDHWPCNSEVPHGHYVRKLGADGDKSVETQVLLHEFGVPNEAFSDEVMSCLPPSTWNIGNDVMLNNNRYLDKGMSDSMGTATNSNTTPTNNTNNTSSVLRRDLRSLPVVSIDPPGCKDIDDALHCRVLGNGNYEIGVHIADVTYFVHPGPLPPT